MANFQEGLNGESADKMGLLAIFSGGLRIWGSSSQTRRDTKLRYTQIIFQLWSNMWSGKFYHNYGELSRGVKRGISR